MTNRPRGTSYETRTSLKKPVLRIRIRLDPDSHCQTGSGFKLPDWIRIQIARLDPDPDPYSESGS